jgi:endonuclease-3 related protein
VKSKTVKNIYQTLLKHYGPQHWWPGDTPFEVMVGAILTQRTSWRNVEQAIKNLKKAGLMTADSIAGSSVDKIRSLVRPSGFYNVKAERLFSLARYLNENYDSPEDIFKNDIQDVREELLGLRGIGKETADSMILYAGNNPIFVVDAYTKRMCERLDIPVKSLDYDDLQSYFQEAMPKDANIYKEFHALIVIHGKEMCKTRPVCKGCPLQSICCFRE